jgi:hypothetical protein
MYHECPDVLEQTSSDRGRASVWSSMIDKMRQTTDMCQPAFSHRCARCRYGRVDELSVVSTPSNVVQC